MTRTIVYKKNEIILYGIVLVVSFFSFIFYLLFNINFNEAKDYTTIIYSLSCLGILAGIYVLFTWYKLTGQFFSLYTIFMLFFFLFIYGQPLMWALGIHLPNEIGEVGLYTLGKPSSSNIVYTQILTLISITMFHFGAVFCYKSKTFIKQSTSNNTNGINSQVTAKAIFYACLIL